MDSLMRFILGVVFLGATLYFGFCFVVGLPHIALLLFLLWASEESKDATASPPKRYYRRRRRRYR